MKKSISLILLVILLILTAGCGQVDSDGGSVSSNNSLGLNNSSETSKPTSSVENVSSKEDTLVDDWRTHPEDYKLIALTYDDAPSFSDATGNSTVKIIDTLNRYEGRGTLFVIGNKLTTNGDALLKFAVDKGFELGNHTYSHKSVSTSEVGKNWTATENLDDFKRCQDIVETWTGVKMKYLRPAGVHANEALYEAAKGLGLPCISGNCKSAVSDYKSDVSAEMIVERVLDNAFDGAIILLHGNNTRTAEATERICDILYNEGYRFCTVDELFRFKGLDYDNLPSGVMLYGVDPVTGEPIVEKEY
ncbi:MAG: polysaccharide deacetylase family protein [Clostridia bacterium]|nr:polysaccharide deacetylase family protein [Clostridia bacterium]